MNKNIVIVVLLIVAGLYGGSLLKGCTDAKEVKALNKALEAELVTWKDKDGNNVAKITAFEARDSETFVNLETKDSLILELQDEVTKAKLNKSGSVTIVEGETKIDTVFINNDNVIYTSLFDTPLSSGFSNEWISAGFSISLDSLADNTFKVGETTFSMLTKNKYVVTLDRKKGELSVMVKNLNPYSETTAMRAFQVSDKSKPKLSLGAFFGPGVLLNKDPQLGLVLGAGLNYKF